MRSSRKNPEQQQLVESIQIMRKKRLLANENRTYSYILSIPDINIDAVRHKHRYYTYTYSNSIQNIL